MNTKKVVIYGGLAALGYYLYKQSQTPPGAAAIAPKPMQIAPILAGSGVPTGTPQIAPSTTLAQAAATAAAPATAGVGPGGPAQSSLSGTVFSANRGLGSLG